MLFFVKNEIIIKRKNPTFDVIFLHVLQEIKNDVKAFANTFTDTHLSSVVVLLSHGGSVKNRGNYITGRDFQKVFLQEEVFDIFMDTSALAGKPKVFFVQACRGGMLTFFLTLV